MVRPLARRLLLSRLVRKQVPHWLVAGLGGVAGSILDIVTLIALVEGGTRVALAAFSGAAAGAVVCFLVNKYWAFRDHTPLSLRQVGSFGVVAVGTALLMAAAMQVVVVGMGVPYLLAKLLCAAVVFAVWSYPAQRQLVFRRPVLVEPEAASSMA